MQLLRNMCQQELQILEKLSILYRFDSEVQDLLDFLKDHHAMAFYGITNINQELIDSIYKNIQVMQSFFNMSNLPWFSYDDGVFSAWVTVYGVHTKDITVNWDSRYTIDEHLETLYDAMIDGEINEW